MLSNSEKKKIEYFNNPSKIRKLRLKIGSQDAMAKEVGISRIHYGNIEKGIKDTTLETATKIAEALNSKVSVLFKKSGEKKFIAKNK